MKKIQLSAPTPLKVCPTFDSYVATMWDAVRLDAFYIFIYALIIILLQSWQPTLI